MKYLPSRKKVGDSREILYDKKFRQSNLNLHEFLILLRALRKKQNPHVERKISSTKTRLYDPTPWIEITGTDSG